MGAEQWRLNMRQLLVLHEGRLKGRGLRKGRVTHVGGTGIGGQRSHPHCCQRVPEIEDLAVVHATEP